MISCKINDSIWEAYYLMYINPHANGCYNLDQAFEHWIKTGRHNGNILFDWEYYLIENCIPNVTTLEKALEHYLLEGLASCYKTTLLSGEDDIIASYFNYRFYVSNYSLHKIKSRREAIYHYKNKGQSLGYIYNEYMDNKIYKREYNHCSIESKFLNNIAEKENCIILHYNDLSEIKHVENALTQVYRSSYSRLLKMLLLIKIELVRISSDLQFNVTQKQKQVVQNYILQIQDIIENTVYHDNRLFQAIDDGSHSVVVLSDESGIVVDKKTDYRLGQQLDFVITIKETNLFKSLDCHKRKEFNEKWMIERNNKLENDLLISNIKDDIKNYNEYLNSILETLQSKNELLMKIFHNQKNLMNSNSENDESLLDMLKTNFAKIQQRHIQFLNFIENNSNILCNSSYESLDEISQKPFNSMLVDLKKIQDECHDTKVNSSSHFVTILDDSISEYKDLNLSTITNIDTNLDLIKSTQESIEKIFLEFTNQHLSYTFIQDRTIKLQKYISQLELNFKKQLSLGVINHTITEIQNILNVMNVDTINQTILNNQLMNDAKHFSLQFLNTRVDNSIKMVKSQQLLMNRLLELIEKIEKNGHISLFNTIFKQGFFDVNCEIKQTGKKFICCQESKLGKHIVKLPYGIYLDISQHNPLSWCGKPIFIQAKNLVYKKCKVYCKDKLQYEVKVDTMHLNIHPQSILFGNFSEVKQSLCYIENATDIVIGNFKNLHSSTLKL